MRFLCLALAISAASPVMADGATDRGLREISKCWGVGSASTAAMEAVIVMDAIFRPDGGVERTEMVSAQGPSEAGNRTAYETARRAIMRCGANGKAWAGETVRFEFNYQTMRIELIDAAPFKPIEI